MSERGGGIASPCIGICRMDEARGLCAGCLRTLDEIAGWSRAADAEKLAILARVERRRAAIPASARAAVSDGMTKESEDARYPCVGVCMADPDSGYCLGCGRPPLPVTGEIVVEAVARARVPAATGDPDSPPAAPGGAA